MESRSSSCALLLVFLCFVQSFNNVRAAAAGENPFTPEASLRRYLKRKVSNDLPDFLLSKSSPLSAAQSAYFSRLTANQTSLSENLPGFCSQAKLLCFPELSPSLEKHADDVKFSNYHGKNFSNFGSGVVGGIDTFKTYSVSDNVVVDTFRRFSHGSTSHAEEFTNYGTDSNVVDQSFNTYGSSATGGRGKFSNYGDEVNVPNLRFTSYSNDANGRTQTFTAYTEQANSGGQGFSSYAREGNGDVNAFTSYGKDSNVIGSSFKNYGQNGNGAEDTFTSYAFNGNNPGNNFKNYGAQGNAATETFTSYRDQSNVGDDNFQSYGKASNAVTATFTNYGNSFNEGTDKFTTYGQGSTDSNVAFKAYGTNNSFAAYDKQGTTTFTTYKNDTSAASAVATDTGLKRITNKFLVEPGKFFREAMLKTGNTMPMPDMRDKMPQRSFLPRAIVSKLPFSVSKIPDIKSIFRAGESDSSMTKMLTSTLTDCERTPSVGETKRCVASIEDMVDFATSVLGRSAVVRTTENTEGSGRNIMVGEVRGINGGNVTQSVSCHQGLFPYLVYYCHSVPKVRVYEADILDLKSEKTVNRGVAICHLDTESWSATHGAFVALGSGPGEIEVCHWIFENDMTWATADPLEKRVG